MVVPPGSESSPKAGRLGNAASEQPLTILSDFEWVRDPINLLLLQIYSPNAPARLRFGEFDFAELNLTVIALQP